VSNRYLTVINGWRESFKTDPMFKTHLWAATVLSRCNYSQRAEN